jgi:hypothetical protein
VSLSEADRQHVFESLRAGLVPLRGIDTFAVGIEKDRAELHRQLDLAHAGEGAIKFLRGDYGCGKTFMARMAILDAQARGFATSFVVMSDNDLQFHRFDDVYRKVMTNLGTATCPQGALNDILDRWIANVEEGLVAAGADEDADDFDGRVQERLAQELQSLTRGRAPADLVRVIQVVFQLKQELDYAEAGALVSWLSGSRNVSAGAKRRADIKGDLLSTDAMDYLRGILEIVKAAGYRGMLIVIDEAETILRMRRDTRGRSLNGIRQIADAAPGYPGLVWLFTGTPDFFDSRRGVAGLPPLYDRIAFREHGGRASRRQPQLVLRPFDRERLRAVALRLRELYPAEDRVRLEQKIDATFIEQLVAQVTDGFRGDVGVVPRQFLRELVGQLDLVDEDPDYEPAEAYGFQPQELTAPERAQLEEAAGAGAAGEPEEPDEDALIPTEDVW